MKPSDVINRIFIAGLMVPYLYGVFTGYFADHYGPMSISNPDTWIHGGLATWGIMLPALWFMEYRRNKPAGPEEKGTV